MDLADLWFGFHTLIFMMGAYHRCLGSSVGDMEYDDDDPLLVKTTKGYVRGVTLKSATNKYVDAFLGIPFTRPPLGKYRFRHPKPIDPWTGTYNATEKPNACFQINDTYFGDFAGSAVWNPNTPLSEDCLKINVWVPRPRPKKAAVMVWIYGGGFYSGSSSLDVYDPKILVSEEQIIIVSINYRVASLGFLYFGIPEAPGNAGLYDQLMGLHWVKDNIEKFGGNPLNVTLFGESAGAASVNFHLLSPLSRHLFNQAAIQSGAAVAPWAIIDKKEIIERGLRLAEALKCPNDPHNLQAVVNCLREKDAFEMVSNEWGNFGVVEFPFGPIVDGAFIDELPSISMQTKNFKKAKILSGTNAEEGMYFIIYYLTDYFKKIDEVYLTREDFKTCVRELNPYVGNLGQEAIIFEYTDWLNPDDPIKNRDAVDKMVGDYYFTCGVNEFSLRYAETGNDVYKYFFAHRASVSPWPKWMGVLHGDEIAFVFGEPLNSKLGYNDEEKNLSRKMMRYWANFAKNGNPSMNENGEWESVYWPVHTTYGKEYLTLATNSSAIGHGLRSRQCAFWQEFLPMLVETTASFHNPGVECKTSSTASLMSDGISSSSRNFSLLFMLCAILARDWPQD